MRPIVGKGLLAQLVEHLPFKEVVLGSSPRQVTNKFPSSSWPRTPPFHGENTGSNPVGNATLVAPVLSSPTNQSPTSSAIPEGSATTRQLRHSRLERESLFFYKNKYFFACFLKTFAL